MQSVLRFKNSLSEAKAKRENTVLAVMDYESCYKRIWRAGLLHKTSKIGIDGRMWLYIKNFYETGHTTPELMIINPKHSGLL